MGAAYVPPAPPAIVEFAGSNCGGGDRTPSCGLQLAHADERGLGLCSVGWGAGLRTGRMDQIVLQAGGLVCRDLWRWEDGYS